MMDNFKKEAQKIRLSVDEKTRMRAQIFEQPVVVAPSTSPYFSFFTVSALLNVRSATAAVLIFALVGSSTAYAAQGSLPGDLLYSVKIAVNERMELALATTPEKEIIVETRLAERRVLEAQALEASGRLDATTTDSIEREFDKHASRALALAHEEPLALDDEIEVESSKMQDAPAQASMLMVVPESAVSKVAKMELEFASTTTEVGDGDFVTSLKAHKKTLKELRARVQERGEVRGVGIEHGRGSGLYKDEE